jgi:hypothetical protein
MQGGGISQASPGNSNVVSGSTRVSHVVVGGNDQVTVHFNGYVSGGPNPAIRWYVYA